MRYGRLPQLAAFCCGRRHWAFDRETDRFFNEFPPRFDSRYREGFEYLDYIGRTFNLRCAVRVFLIATNVDLGIVEASTGQLEYDKDSIKERLLETDSPNWRSHFRLRNMAELLLENERKPKNFFANKNVLRSARNKTVLWKNIYLINSNGGLK